MISLHAPSTLAPSVDEAVWASAPTLAQFVDHATQNQELWRTTMRLARLAPEEAARSAALHVPARVLVLLEDWCGDAMYTVPFVQRVVDANPLLEMRVLARDQHDALMAAHLSGTARSIPVVMAFGPDGAEVGWWGPRPTPLQQWMIEAGLAMEKPERYKAVRTWYARDRGVTTAQEILTLLERVGSAASNDQRSPTITPV